MLIKISCDDEYFEQIIRILKLKFKTGAASKAAKAAIIDYEYIVGGKGEIKSKHFNYATNQLNIKINFQKTAVKTIVNFNRKCLMNLIFAKRNTYVCL